MTPRRVPFDPRPVGLRIQQLQARGVLERAEAISVTGSVHLNELLEVRRGKVTNATAYRARAEFFAFLRDERGFPELRIAKLFHVAWKTVRSSLRTWDVMHGRTPRVRVRRAGVDE